MPIAMPERSVTADDKQQARLDEWASAPGLTFASPSVERGFKERARGMVDAIHLKKSTRVLVSPPLNTYPIAYAGMTPHDAMYDYAKLGEAIRKFHADFQPDFSGGCRIYGPGKLFDILDYKLYRWPGHGVDKTMPYQCVETDYMKTDEYDRLIADPSGYFMRTYLPRVFGGLAALQAVGPLTDLLELPFIGGWMIPVGQPEVQEALTKLQRAGEAAVEWRDACVTIEAGLSGELGLPGGMGGFTKAPFDSLGDTLRGTRQIMIDKFRQPEKLLAALDRWVPLAVDMGVRNANASHNPMSFIPLHKGADGFMSDEDFRKFYWPTLKAVILGLIEEGVVPYLFVEGSYNERLDVIADSGIPAGKTVWLFDKTDMKEVKKKLGSWACFAGNVPVSMLQAGTPQKISDYVKRLIDDVAADGGFILSNGAALDHAQAENLHAMIDTCKEYGVYR